MVAIFISVIFPMKTTKKEFANLIKEVAIEMVKEYEQVTMEEYRVFFIDQKTQQPVIYKMRVQDKWSLDMEIENFIKWQKQEGKDLMIDPVKSPQYIRRIRLDDEGNIGESLAVNIPNSKKFQEAKPIDGTITEVSDKKWWNVSLDRPGAGWSEVVQANTEQEARKIANKKHPGEEADTAWETETPQKNLPGSDKDKWKKISGAESTKPNSDIKQFALDIKQKILDRRRKKGWSDMSYPDALQQMIEFKLSKEGWTKNKSSTVSQDDVAFGAEMRGKYGENINEASKGNYTQALRKVKSLIDQSPEKKNLKALIKTFDGEPMLEVRAYGLPMGGMSGDIELEDAFGNIVRSLTDDNWHVAEIDENETGGRQYKYALFTFPESGKMPGDSIEVQNAIDMGR